MSFEIVFTKFAEDDLAALDSSVRVRVIKTLLRVAENPRTQAEGGYGKPLGNRSGTNLTGLLKIKLLGVGIRIVYALREVEGKMVIIVVSAREGGKAYSLAASRRKSLPL